MSLHDDDPYPRDLIGYGATPPDPRWPDGAAIAVQFVLNYEEGAEQNPLHGDPGAETFLSEMFDPAPFANRHMSMESLYEYGSRAGLWRVLNVFARRGLPLTIFGVAKALERNPEAVAAFGELGHEIACHGLWWKSYQLTDEHVERADMAEAVELMTALTGEHPLGWYTGRDSPNTRRLVVEQGGFLYDSDSYADDLPYWTTVETDDGTHPQLVVPYTLETNDMKYSSPQGFSTGRDFEDYLRDAFDVLYAEGLAGQPKMLNVGLHCRLAGRPARTAALERFLDHVQSHDRVWITRRVDIARHWREVHPFTG
ncbi:MAG: allantoinase PuuE [Gordonia sp. (in: high G+C Gram-positive bacteria)]|uniref:allantoinase PuuE n=1 Tax=Gordonia sp. (in: high G+C Gram-positive bacteria) TaxID=84139 RepID=UPI0039E39541